MHPDQAFSDLIGAIYDCSLDTGQWPRVLALISDALGGQMADMIISHPLERRQSAVFLHNWTDELWQIAVANAHLNPVLPLGLTQPLCEPFCKTRHIDVEAFHRSRFWKTCYEGRGFGDYFAVPITRTVTSFGTWGVIAHEDKQAYTDEDLELARMLSPHIRRSVEISGVLGQQRIEAGTLRAALDTLSVAALVVEPSGTIRYCNQSASKELGRGLVVRETRGRLLGVTREASKFLSVLASTAERRQQHGLDVFLTDHSGRTLHVTWAVLDQAGDELGTPILLLMREPEKALTTPLSTAASLFRLTAAETQVLAQLLQGKRLDEVGAILGIARSTVKTHLKNLYRKTQTGRQAELLKVVYGLSSPLIDVHLGPKGM